MRANLSDRVNLLFPEVRPHVEDFARRRCGIGLSLLCAVSLGLPLWLAVETGSLGIPHNDSWAYSKIAQHFARTGQIQLLGWNRGALLGQVWLVGPLGRSLIAQHLVVFTLGLVAAGLTFLLVSRISGRVNGLLATALTLFFPGYSLLSLSFMQDVPAYLATVLCLLMGHIALRNGNKLILAAALLVGIWGFTVREQVLAAPVAVLAALFWRERKVARSKVWISVAAVLLVLAFVSFEVLRGGLPGADPVHLGVEGLSSVVHRTYKAYYTLALVVAPAVVAQLGRGRLTRRQVLAAGVVGAVELALFFQASGSRGFFGNYLTQYGSYPVAHRGLQVVIPGTVLHVLEACALISGALLPVLVRRDLRRLGPLLSVFSLLTILGTVAEIVVGQTVFDRYLLALVPMLVVALGPVPGPRGQLRAAVAVVPLAVLTLALAGNALALDGAEWQAGRALVRQGAKATDVDAGFDWVGYHAAGPADQERQVTSPTRPFYLAMFPGSRDCYSVSLNEPSELDEGPVIARWRYRTYGLWGSSTLYVSAKRACPGS